MKLSVIIVSYDSGSLLKKCIESLSQFRQELSNDFHIVVVDAHPSSLDFEIELDVDLYIRQPDNPGFGRCNNVGILQARQAFKTEFFLLLNPDAYLSETFYETLQKTFAESNHSIINPISPLICFDKTYLIAQSASILDFSDSDIFEVFDFDSRIAIYSNDGKKIHSFELERKYVRNADYILVDPLSDYDVVMPYRSINSKVPLETVKLDLEDRRLFSPQYLIQNAGGKIRAPWDAGDSEFEDLLCSTYREKTNEMTTWCGAAVILSWEYIKRTRGFDERFFLYYEDTDLSVRGSELEMSPMLHRDLVVFHRHSHSTQRSGNLRSLTISRSRVLFVANCFGKRFAITILATKFLRIIKYLFRGGTLRHAIKYFIPDLVQAMQGFFISFKRFRSGIK